MTQVLSITSKPGMNHSDPFALVFSSAKTKVPPLDLHVTVNLAKGPCEAPPFKVANAIYGCIPLRILQLAHRRKADHH